MPNQDLLNYVKQELAKGTDTQALIDSLLKTGWNQQQINSAFSLISSQNFQALSPQEENSSQNLNALPGFKKLIGKAWEIYLSRWKTFILISAFPLFFIILILISIIFIYQSLISPNSLVLIPCAILIAIGIGGLILFNLWSPVALLYSIKDRNEKIGFKAAFGRGRRKILVYIILSFIIGIITFLGFMLLIIPGIILLIWFNFAVYILISENTGIIEALKKSKQYVSGKFFETLYRLAAIFLFTQIINSILLAIPIVNLSAVFILTLALSPLSTIYTFILYENLKNLNGKKISNPLNKLFTIFILFLMILLLLFIFIISSNLIPTIVKNLSARPSTSYQQDHKLPNVNSKVSPTPIPTTTCTVDWQYFPLLIKTGEISTFSATFKSNFGTRMPSIYIYPNGSTLYREYNAQYANLNTVTINVTLTGPANGTYTLKPYLDDEFGKGIECNEVTFNVGPTPSPTVIRGIKPVNPNNISYPVFNFDDQRKKDLNVIQMALSTYVHYNKSTPKVFPATLDELIPTYLTILPKDPKTGLPYEYNYNGLSWPLSDYNLCANFDAFSRKCITSFTTISDIK